MLWLNSDAFELSSLIAECDAARRRTTRFERDVTLPPNAARLDVIAYDVLVERASTREFEVDDAKR